VASSSRKRRVRSTVRLAEVVRELPRRAHDLSATTVRASQRWRMLEAVTEAVARDGYAAASVADVIAIAGVSRKTFYEQFDDKEDCFLTAYDVMSARFAEALAGVGTEGSVEERMEARIRAYLKGLAREPAMARAFVVEVLGAGARALARRERVTAKFAELLLGETSADPLSRRAIIGGINDVVAAALLAGADGARLLALVAPLTAFFRRAAAGGA
jgi:AcrR family transcriptional regulator